MSDLLNDAHKLMRYSHIAMGFAGLVLFWAPVFLEKGGRWHVYVGRIFAFCAAYVGMTGLIGSVWAITDPLSFSGASLSSFNSQRVPYVIENLRFLFSILAYLSLAILCGVVFGVRVIRTRQDHALLRGPLLLGLEGMLGLVSAALVVFGGWNLVESYLGRHLLPGGAASKYWIPVGLGLFGLLGVWGDLCYIFRPRPTPMAWWYKHMENMVGVGIGFHTAFLLFGVTRILAIRLHGPWQLVPWLLPAAIGLPAVAIWVSYYRRRFGESREPEG